VTPKGQTRDPIIFEAPYLRNGARWTHGHYGPPIGTRHSGVEWSIGCNGGRRLNLSLDKDFLLSRCF